MKSFIQKMHPDVKVSNPFKGQPEKVAEIRKRLIKSTRESAEEFIKNQRKSREIMRLKAAGLWSPKND